MIVALGGDEACHQGAVAEPVATGPFGRYFRAVVDKIPAVDVVDITVSVIVDPRLTVHLGFVRPEPVTQILVVYPKPIVEHRHNGRMSARLVAPRQGSGYI